LKQLPFLPANVATVFAACGKVSKTKQVPMAIAALAKEPGGDGPRGVVATPTGEAILAAVRAYRAKMPELLATLPHDLPLQVEDPAPRDSLGDAGLGSQEARSRPCFRAARL
jgi:hypothetical protein